MNRAQLEHVIRAASAIAQDEELVIIGSQAILGAHPDAPPEMCVSADVDLYPRHRPERAELIEGSIGEISPFHESFGYYAQGVGPETAVLPSGWEARLVPVPVGTATGWCLDPHDLFASKYAAGRPKDREYLRAAIRAGLLRRAELAVRLDSLPLAKERIAALRAALDADLSAAP
jgi:hypothetical protein